MLAEKYRPKRIDEIIGQDHLKPIVKEFIKRGDIPNMLFVGPAGVGKTSMAHAIANELGWSIVELNASDERGIQVIRNEVKMLAFTRGKKIILLDEADNMTEDAQHALRRIMEKATERGDARFILTANYEWKIIDPIRSRCVIMRFEKLPRELIIRRLVEILKAEGVRVRSREELEELKNALNIIVEVSNGDMRRCLNMLETVLSSGRKITTELVKSLVSPNLVAKAVELALGGNLDEAVNMLENALVTNRLNQDVVINELYKSILRINDGNLKAKALLELARAEHAIKMGGSPLIQTAAILSVIWYESLRKR